ncbi:hypothetical protein SAMN05661080_01702 [Modestobacter sp. DSM 44400]|uniref:hypothetical protein n=1 Tax=Modestobacter sp. DSM 44400 TaxID=1550230 RepID=UPI00089D4620|nr:hypothetical protein [Modestobacter sp. DSM 44400]SDX91471.1 hypothetical protein SAMN05661080_01702 [Modestobacter sp. DSM 44400]
MSPDSGIDKVRTIADAVLYEGYLLYPYRASSRKNQSRWQFGVLGPPGASAVGLGEEPGMAMQCLLAPGQRPGSITVHLRFLHLQAREVQRLDADGRFVPVDELTVDGLSVLSWDEAVEREITLPAHALADPVETLLEVPGGEDVEPLSDSRGHVVGRVLRRRWPLAARVAMHTTADGDFLRLSVSVDNQHPGPAENKDAAIRSSLIGAHLVLKAQGADFVSLLEPSDEASGAATRCSQRRCWPVLAGAPGATDVVLGAPIILYDYPEVAEQSPGALFDGTEIDEILTLRVMTLTDEEKAEARATDPLARAIIDRCDDMSAADLQQLHGILRDPHAAALVEAVETPFTDLRDADLRNAEPPSFGTGDVPWWDPEADADVQPGTDAVVIDGVPVARGSLVRVHPSRRADAQDLFFADQVARVTAVLSDVDGAVHVALVLVDDPAADLHDWYGRYFYFAPDELEPLGVSASAEGPAQPEPAKPDPVQREESRS